MTSAVPGDWSELTPAWMSLALQAAFPGVQVGSVEVEHRDDGTNRRARLRLTYTEGIGPEVVFAKAEGAWRQAHVANGNMFNEAELYRSGVPLPVEHPRPFHVVIDRPRLDHLIVMEDVTARGGVPLDGRAALTVGQVEDGVHQLAALHGAHWRLAPSAPGLEWLLPWGDAAGWRRSLAPGLPIGRQRAADLLEDACAGYGDEDLLDLCSSAIESFGTGQMTLVHGDPHVGNTYAMPGGRIGLLDWQVCRWGCWAMDLAYFIVSALTVDDRRAAEQELLDRYRAALRVPDAERPSRDEVRRRYDAAHAYGLVVWTMTHQSDRAQSPEVCRSLIERFAAAFVDGGRGRALERLATTGW